MSKKMLHKVLYVLGFGISGISTILLMMTVGDSKVTKLIGIGMAIFFEFSKGLAFINVFNKKLNEGVKSALFLMWIFLVCASIFASQALMFNETNKKENTAKKSSATYQGVLKQQDVNKSLLEQKKSEIESLKADKVSQIGAMEKVRDAYPKNYITMKENAQTNINKKSSELQGKIDAKIKEMETVASNLNKSLDMSNIKYTSEDEDGYTAVLKVVGSWVGLSPDEMKFWFFLMLTVVFELLICFMYYLSKVDFEIDLPILKPTSPSDKPKFKKPKLSENDSHLSPKNLSGNLSGTLAKRSKLRLLKPVKGDKKFNENVQKYMKVMEDTQKNDICISYQKISKMAGLTDHQGAKIKGHLEEKGILEVINGKTKIIRKEKAI